jgi:hypothetical protein
MTINLTPDDVGFIIESVEHRRAGLELAMEDQGRRLTAAMMTPFRAKLRRMDRLIAKLAAARKGEAKR